MRAIETKLGPVTVRTAEPLIDPEVAVIVVLPCALVVARPAVEIVATDVDADVHVAEFVKFCVLPSV